MSAWTKAALVSETVVGGMTSFAIDGEDCVLIRKTEQEWVAFIDRCSHQDVRLSEFGEVNEAGELVCFAHGARFSLCDGKALCKPASSALEEVQVELRGQELWARLQD